MYVISQIRETKTHGIAQFKDGRFHDITEPSLVAERPLQSTRLNRILRRPDGGDGLQQLAVASPRAPRPPSRPAAQRGFCGVGLLAE
jgi:hypothetical protein